MQNLVVSHQPPTLNGKRRMLWCLGLIVAMSGVGCDRDGDRYQDTRAPLPPDMDWAQVFAGNRVVKYTPELAREVREQGWLDKNCLAMNLSEDERRRCVLVRAAELPPFDPSRPEHFAATYDRRQYLQCRLERKTSACREYALRRNENPEYWPYPDVPKPKWPEPAQRAKYRSGMSAEDYFKELCEKEAGEFIYKTVGSVESIYQIRPRAEEPEIAMKDRYVIEDPYGHSYSESESPAKLFVNYPFNIYRYFEIGVVQSESSTPGNRIFRRSRGYEDRKKTVPGEQGRPKLISIRKPMIRENVAELKSRYGFTWRGLNRIHDRELGLAGGELMVVDLTTGEVLAVRRGFKFGRSGAPGGVYWLRGVVCPPERNLVRRETATYDFVSKVVTPPSVTE
jgi:hypothetical protein